MNIFALHDSPVISAQMQHDKHVVKMILETAQMLSAVAHRHEFWKEDRYYRPSHQNHPCTLWAGDSTANAHWLLQHGWSLAEEYRYRYEKRHASSPILDAFYVDSTKEAAKFPSGFLTPMAQAMPDQYKVPGDAVQAYRNYYLGEKLHQSRWTRRPVPELFKEKYEMAKKDKISGEPVVAPSADAAAPVEATAAAPALSKIGVKGLKGIPLTAKVTLLATKNPKRPGSMAEKKFALYFTGITQQEFLDQGGTTPDLAYDTAHGFIEVEGYTPPKRFAPKPKAEKVPKEPKPPKAKKEKVAHVASTADTEAVEAAVVEETIE